MGLCTIWLLTFAVSQNAVPGNLSTHLLPGNSPLRGILMRKIFSSEFWFKQCKEPAKDPAPGTVTSFISATLPETHQWQVGASHAVHLHGLLLYIFVTSCYIIDSD